MKELSIFIDESGDFGEYDTVKVLQIISDCRPSVYLTVAGAEV